MVQNAFNTGLKEALLLHLNYNLSCINDSKLVIELCRVNMVQIGETIRNELTRSFNPA